MRINMGSKTNKAMQKRLKITRRGKVLKRKGGQIHYRAKKKRTLKLQLKKRESFNIPPKQLKQYLPYH